MERIDKAESMVVYCNQQSRWIFGLRLLWLGCVLISLAVSQSVDKHSFSFVPNWTNKGDPSLCFENYVCTPSGKSFDVPFVKGDEMCSFLVLNNIKNIHFYGDSYMRHVYVATSLFLTNNYKNASLSKDDAHCKYGNQFSEEMSCREIVAPSVVSCDGIVQLFLHYLQPPSLDYCGDGHLSFWSEGNHPVDWNYTTRLGVNDPVEYQKKFNRLNYGICPVLVNDTSKKCSLYWISTHARRKKFPDEEDGQVQLFNEHMRQFFEAGKCGGGTGYVDVYNMSANLIHMHPAEAKFMSFDEAHWGIEVNLVKVQIMMQTFAYDSITNHEALSLGKNPSMSPHPKFTQPTIRHSEPSYSYSNPYPNCQSTNLSTSQAYSRRRCKSTRVFRR